MTDYLIQTEAGTDRLGGSVPVYVKKINNIFLRKKANELMEGDKVLYKCGGRYFIDHQGRQVSKLKSALFKEIYGKEGETKIHEELAGEEKETVLDLIRETLKEKGIRFAGEDIENLIEGERTELETKQAFLELFPGLDLSQSYPVRTVLKTKRISKEEGQGAKVADSIYSSDVVPDGIKAVKTIKVEDFSRKEILGSYGYEEAITNAVNFIQQTGFNEIKVVRYLLGEKGDSVENTDMGRLLKNLGSSTKQGLEVLLDSSALDSFGLSKISNLYTSLLGMKKEDFYNGLEEPSIEAGLVNLSKNFCVTSVQEFKKRLTNSKPLNNSTLMTSKERISKHKILMQFVREMKQVGTISTMLALIENPQYKLIRTDLKEFAEPFNKYIKAKQKTEEKWKEMDNAISACVPEIVSKKKKVDRLILGLETSFAGV